MALPQHIFTRLRNKLDVLDRILTGSRVKDLVSIGGPKKTAIYSWRKKEARLREIAVRRPENMEGKLFRKSEKYSEFVPRMLSLLEDFRSNGYCICELDFKILYELAYKEKFLDHVGPIKTPSRSWIQKFKKKYKIRVRRVVGELLSANQQSS